MFIYHFSSAFEIAAYFRAAFLLEREVFRGAHIIADQYFGQINNKLANPNCYSEEGIKLRRSVNEAYRKAKSTGDIYKISEYASSDEQEFFAETFAMYHLGEELPAYIRDMVKGVLEHGAV